MCREMATRCLARGIWALVCRCVFHSLLYVLIKAGTAPSVKGRLRVEGIGLRLP